MSLQNLTIPPVLNFVDRSRANWLSKVLDFVSIPSISTLPSHRPHIQKASQWLTSFMKQVGLEHIKLVSTPGYPIVYGDYLRAKDKPTVLIYGHYDVQPADTKDGWTTNPFKPVVNGDRLYGRGTSDNKCQHLIHLMAVEAYLKTIKKLPVNIKFAIEGEEEIGSSHFIQALKANKDLFAHDVSIIADVGMPKLDVPCIFYGLRGIVYTQFTLTGPKQDIHSGVFGGVVPNPGFIIAKILSNLKTAAGKITISHFYDRVVSVGPEERQLLARHPRNESDTKQETGVSYYTHEPGFKHYEQTKIRPSLDVNGLYSGYTGPGSKTIIPSTATAKVSMRLVPDQDPDVIYRHFSAFIKKQARNYHVKVTIKKLGSEPAVVTDHQSPEIDAVKQALKTVFGKTAVLNRSGGSISAAAHLKKIYGKPMVMTGFSPPGDNLHGPNENFYLPNFYKGIQATIRIYANLGNLS